MNERMTAERFIELLPEQPHTSKFDARRLQDTLNLITEWATKQHVSLSDYGTGYTQAQQDVYDLIRRDIRHQLGRRPDLGGAGR